MRRKSKHFYEGGSSDDDQSFSDNSDLTDPRDPASGPINPTRPSAAPSAAPIAPADDSSSIEDESDRGSMTPEQQANSNATNPAPKKPKIVTKEELAKSGLSLRDYMNKQQGLTRRESPKSVTVEKTTISKPNPSTSSATTAKVSMADLEKKHAGLRKQLEESDKPLEEVHPEQYLINPTGGMFKAAAGLARSLGRGAAEKAGTELAKRGAEKAVSTVAKKAKLKEYYPHELTPQLRSVEKEVKRLTGPTSKNAKGGMINKSKASSRADGIAKKGHTRGRMC